jgi:hypothetical protein
MKFQLLAALPLLALVACNQQVEAPGEEDAARLAATERLMGLETCADAERDYGSQLPQLTPCRLDLGAGKPSFIISSDTIIASDTESLGTFRAELAGEDGASLQLIEEKVEAAFSYPTLDDIDGDLQPDLLIPLYTAMVNTNYALWLQGADGRFTRAGEIAGYSIGMASNGLIAATGRSSAAEWETRFYQITGGQLDEVAIVVNRLNEEGTPEECRVIEVAEGFDSAPFCEASASHPG